jgi:hypothetical protein
MTWFCIREADGDFMLCAYMQRSTDADPPELHPVGSMFECSGCKQWSHHVCM